MLGLHWDTPIEWADEALGDPGALLFDHLFCERKAASMARRLARRHGASRPALRKLMADLVAEEDDHAEQVERFLKGYPDARPPPGSDRYVVELRRGGLRSGPGGFLDHLLVASLVEARSAERFQLLARAGRGSVLGGFYEDLYASEVDHYLLFVRLAVDEVGEELALARLDELRALEAKIARALPTGPRIH